MLDREALPETELGHWLYHHGALRYDQGRYSEAAADYERAIEIHRRADAELPDGLEIHQALALFAQGARDRAIEVVQHRLEQTATTYGPDHPRYGEDHLVLGTLMVDNGAAEAGVELLARGIEILGRSPGYKAALRARALVKQAQVFNAMERPAEAEPLARRAHALLVALPSPDTAAEVQALRVQADARRALGDPSAALALYRRALARTEVSTRLGGEADALREAIAVCQAQAPK